LELEREQNDLLIIAHESVLRVLYGYLMACNAQDIPALSFPRNEIIEIIPASYNNEATRIVIPGIEEVMIPASPEDIKIPVPPSGTITRKPYFFELLLEVVVIIEKARQFAGKPGPSSSSLAPQVLSRAKIRVYMRKR